MLHFFKRFNLFNKTTERSTLKQESSISEQDLEKFAQQIHDICDNVEEKNLTLVNNTIESTLGHNNHKLVKAAVYFVKECVWVFNSEYANEYAKNDYLNEFIVYLKEVQHVFEQHNYDPDGVGGGTIIDIINSMKS